MCTPICCVFIESFLFDHMDAVCQHFCSVKIDFQLFTFIAAMYVVKMNIIHGVNIPYSNSNCEISVLSLSLPLPKVEFTLFILFCAIDSLIICFVFSPFFFVYFWLVVKEEKRQGSER